MLCAIRKTSDAPKPSDIVQERVESRLGQLDGLFVTPIPLCRARRRPTEEHGSAGEGEIMRKLSGAQGSVREANIVAVHENEQ